MTLNPFLCIDLSISDSLRAVRKSVLIYETIIIIVVACDGKDNMSIRVPEGFLELHKSFKIHSKQFVYETLTGWGLSSKKALIHGAVQIILIRKRKFWKQG